MGPSNSKRGQSKRSKSQFQSSRPNAAAAAAAAPVGDPDTATVAITAAEPTGANQLREPWERLPEESDRDWGFFLLYRNLHPSVRSIGRAFTLYQQQRHEADPDYPEPSEVGHYKAPQWFEHVSAVHGWVDRVRAYDEWQDRDQIERLQSTRVRSLVETATIGRELRTKAAEALEHLRVLAYEHVLGEDGEPTTIAVSTLSPAAIVALAKAGTELERLSIGLRGEGSGGVNVQIANIMGGVPGQVPIPGDDEEVLRKVAKIAAARGINLTGEPVVPLLDAARIPSRPGERED